MKRFNKNIILFVFAFVFIFVGFGNEFRNSAKSSVMKIIQDIKSGYIIGGIVDFTIRAEDDFTKTLSYHDMLMDIDSGKNNLLNTKIIEKNNVTLVKTDSGHITELRGFMSDEAIGEVVAALDQLYKESNANGADFLYVGVANKGYGSALPDNVTNYTNSNYDRFIEKMNQENIPTLDLTEELTKIDMWSDDVFFVTDHHWKPKVAFWANGKICETLDAKYNFEYNKDYIDLKNYNVTTYSDWFLGSYGKKTGRFFVPEGAEDIDIITPDFQTDLASEQPFKNETVSGSFYDVVMQKDFIETKDPHELNAYATYTGGDFELQIVKNNLNPNGKKMLVIRDSFACAVTPFLALNAGELHIMDLRDFANVSGERINVYNYIEKEKPDYVIVLYNGVTDIQDSNGQYQFDNTAPAS